MAVRVNGKQHPWRPGLTVAALLAEHGASRLPVVVRVGPKTVSRKDFDTFEVPDGAEVYLIHMVAGG